ncbi:hypothetical protein FSARC_10536 [Fusarium sarcochroum]|uniref:RBR-type E3 ubiquitin transferase n=1 Tax=Fusarium sarcochroum TaxID=1208366 RepID=A0A8H4TLU0_9HYPO|nr:hypothetical protein FSARC_10536 [Fusarium sarcochroum]
MTTLLDAFDHLHPDLLDLIRKDLLPSDESTGFSEPTLARSAHLAIELADPDEQALLVSRIIPEEELAAQRLQSPEVRNTDHRVVLDRAERKAALKDNTPATGEGNGQDCLVCGESAHVKVPCGCDYCLSCFRDAIRVGLRSMEEFPPKCCQPFTEATIALARSPALVHLFRQMEEEAQIPVPNRLYCHDRNCAAYIPHDRHGECLLCDLRTCEECALKAHPGQTCEEGDAEEDVWATMDANRTVNCPRCGRMIELAEACNHMTCVCGKEFCFICGKDYGTCRRCPPYGHFERMVPMKDRPGNKPAQFRRRARRAEDSAARNDNDAALKIPQLRPFDGEDDRAPTVGQVTRDRVIRPLNLPPPQERRPHREREPERERRRDRGRQHENDGRERRREEGGRRRAGSPIAPNPRQADVDFLEALDIAHVQTIQEVRRERPPEAPPAVGRRVTRQPAVLPVPPAYRRVVRQPVVRQPVIRQPVIRQPIVRQPVVRQPVIRQPIVRQPVVRQPVVRQPVVRQPVVRQPVVRQPAVRQSRVLQPVYPPVMRQSARRNNSVPVVTQANQYGTQGRRSGFDNQRVGQFLDLSDNGYEDGHEHEQAFGPNPVPTMARVQQTRQWVVGQTMLFENHHHHHEHGVERRRSHHHH